MKNGSIKHKLGLDKFCERTIRTFEFLIPDPFVLAILITSIVAVLCFFIAPHGSVGNILTGWQKGFCNIFTFAIQIILVLVTGHALAHAAPVQRLFTLLVSMARTPAQAGALTFWLVALASFFNWGFGLVISALLAREVAKRMRVDFAWIVAVGFSGWVVWASGISSSIALAQSTTGSAMNVVEQLTGKILPIHELIFAPFNIVPIVILFIIMPFILVLIRPSDEYAIPLDITKHPGSPTYEKPKGKFTFAQYMECSWVGSAFIALLGIAFLVYAKYTHVKGFSGVNAVILVMFILGVIMHGHPIAYASAIKSAAKQSGSMMLQYPLYGGIMGMMSATGLPTVIADFFIAISTAHTLPFWSYICSLIVTFLIPSGGGHWAVQGPFVIPAAIQLHASVPATTMAVAIGEEVSNMMQPFWAAPVVAMAGVGVQRVLGFTVITFFTAAIVFGVSLLLLV